jgi:MinD-like ATPase involved in chromosome partitioning or flagellar assembly
MKKLVAIHSYRGGTGKSNITTNLAALVARAGDGNRVGVVDTDISSPGIHVILGLSDERVRLALNDYLWGRCPIEEAAYDVTASMGAGAGAQPAADRPRIYLVPSSVKTGEIARVLREGYDVGLLNDGFRRLAAALALDYLFIDTHPGVNEETLLSIAVSDLVLLVMRPDNQDFQGTAVAVELARRLETRDLRIVINKVPQGFDTDALLRQVESAYKAPVAGMLPLNTEMAKLASSGIFAIPYPNHPFTLGLKPVVDVILS